MNDLKAHMQISHRHPSRRSSAWGTVAILAAASLLGAVVTACGSESTTATTETTEATETSVASPDKPQIVQESAKTTETLRSVHINLTATDLPKFPVGSVNADVTSVEQGNGQAVGNATFRATPNAPFEPTQFLVTNKTFYTKAADGSWTERGPAEKIYDPAVILDKDRGLANVIRNVKDPKVDGNETIDGVATVKLSGTIDAAVVDPVVPTVGQGGGTLPITLWIADVAPASPPPTSIPSDAPSPGTGPNLVRFVLDKDQGSVDVTLSAWAKPVEIPKPTG